MHAMRAELDAQSGQRPSLHVAEPMSRSTLLERVARRPRRSGIQLTPEEPRHPFPDGHFYSPTIDANELASRAAEIWVAEPDIVGIDFNLAGHLLRHFDGNVPSPSPQVRLPRGAARQRRSRPVFRRQLAIQSSRLPSALRLFARVASSSRSKWAVDIRRCSSAT